MEIQELRGQIDRIDKELARLFEQRMEASCGIAAYKKEHGLPIYDPEREKEILSRIEKTAQPKLAPYVRTLYQTLFELSRAYQQSLIGAEDET